jgi:protein O-GlcNAc transferase
MKVKYTVSGTAASVGLLCLAAGSPLFAQAGPGDSGQAARAGVGNQVTNPSQGIAEGAPGDDAAIPQDESDPMQQAYKDYSAKKFAVATPELQAVLKKSPNIVQAHEMLADIYRRQNQVPQSIPELEAVVRLKPKDAGWRDTLGGAYLQVGDFAKAVNVFQTALTQNPTADNASKYAYALEKSGNHAAAAAEFEKASALDPKDSQSALYAGLLYHETGNDTKAVPLLKTAIALGTSQKSTAYTALAEAATAAKQSSDAISYQTQAAQANPADFGIEYNLGVLEQNAGRKADAEAAYRQALTLKTDDPKAYKEAQTNLALLLSNDGKADEAATLLTQAVQANPKDADLQADLGIVEEKQDKKVLALAAFKQALILDPNNSPAKDGVARLSKP